MAKTLIGNIKGKDGRGIASISKTGTTGSVDTYTIRYTDGTTSTYTVNNSDSVSLQRQIVPSAAVESSETASQAYVAGDYVVVNGVLRKVTATIAKGNAISDSNSTATTVAGELTTLGESVSKSIGSVSMASSWSNNGCSLSRVGRTVELVVNSIKTSSASDGETILTIPADFAPSVELDFACAAFDESNYPMSAWVAVMQDGRVAVKNYLANGHHGMQFKAVCRYFV